MSWDQHKKPGCFAIAFFGVLALWLAGRVLNGVTQNWNPVLSKCSIVLQNQYENIKERRLRSKLAYEEKLLAAEEAERVKNEEMRRHAVLDRENVARQKQNALVKEFAEKEATTLWRTLLTLTSEIDTQTAKIKELKSVLEGFGRNPEEDADYRQICEMRDSLIGSVSEIRAKLEDAYIASKKFEATPGRMDYEAIRRKAIEDGVQEADAAIKRFDLMRINK